MSGDEEKEEHFIFTMDGSVHTKREFTDCCWNEGECPKCGKPMHTQGAYGVLLERCENTDEKCSNGGVIDWDT